MTDKMREVFEKMSRRFGIAEDQLKPDEDSCYLDKHTQSHWVVFGIAWAESRETLVIELPAVCAYEGLTQDLGAFVGLTYELPEHDPVELLRAPDVRAAIEDAGLKVKP